MNLFEKILAARGLDKNSIDDFLYPDYDKLHDPFLLPDMEKAVDRLIAAHKKQENVTIYGDYDVDGLSATALLKDALLSFGFKNINTVIPNRFEEGFGLNCEVITRLADEKCNLIVTVDCGSMSEEEIIKANELGIDVVVTDHHNVADVQPPAVAVVNPKRKDHKYPFKDLPGVGVAFKLVQALQTKLDGIPLGREKWLLDLVALGTVCDVVPLIDENRTNVFWGLKVLAKTKRPGLKSLMNVAKIESDKVNARSLGFLIGPRLNASGRLETAEKSLETLLAADKNSADENANYLDELNSSRRSDQNQILKEAVLQAKKFENDSVLVVSGPDWNHGIVGIVAAKLLEKYKKPTFVMQEMGEQTKGSARSYGDFNVADALDYCKDLMIKGGGHKLAAGVTIKTENIDKFRKKINEFYDQQNLKNQQNLLLPQADVEAVFHEIDEQMIDLINQMEPFGFGNPQPIIKSSNLIVKNVRKMGDNGQHLKLEVSDKYKSSINLISFNAPDNFFVEIGSSISVWYQPTINEWQGRKTVEGFLLHLEEHN